jgi:hypothetical protein
VAQEGEARGKVLAKIYRSTGRRGYRVGWQPAEGKRLMKSFAAYGGPRGALHFAESIVKHLPTGSDTAKLTPKQARAALAIFDALDAFHRKTGRAICGASSGGICSWTVCWERPDQFRKALTTIGSYTNIRGGHVYPALVARPSAGPSASPSRAAWTT